MLRATRVMVFWKLASSCRSHSSAATRLRILAILSRKGQFNGEPGLQPRGRKGTEIRRRKEEFRVLFVLGNQSVKLFSEPRFEYVSAPGLGEATRILHVC